MPPQVSGQLVTTKSSKLLHVAGCEGGVAAGAALVAMVSAADASAADASGHVASRRREPVNAIRQAVRAIVSPYGQVSKYDPLKLLATRPLPDALASDVSRRVASRLVLSIGTVDEVGWLIKRPKADIPRVLNEFQNSSLIENVCKSCTNRTTVGDLARVRWVKLRRVQFRLRGFNWQAFCSKGQQICDPLRSDASAIFQSYLKNGLLH